MSKKKAARINQVRIGPQDYKISYEEMPRTKEGNPIDGEINYVAGAIRIRAELNDTMGHQTLWHEIVHAICYHAGIRVKERDVDLIATGILNALRDNRGLRTWHNNQSTLTKQ